jgi:hypothetical protein
LFVGCFASISHTSNKRKQTQIRGDDQSKQQQSWITDSETKTVPKKKTTKGAEKECQQEPIIEINSYIRMSLAEIEIPCRQI